MVDITDSTKWMTDIPATLDDGENPRTRRTTPGITSGRVFSYCLDWRIDRLKH